VPNEEGITFKLNDMNYFKDPI